MNYFWTRPRIFRGLDDRAPVYALLPSGAKANRAFVVGTLTETTDVSDEDEYWQGRVVDPTGTFFVYAGQYQPDAERVLQETEPPAYVAVVGEPRTYETDDGTVNISLYAESLAITDEVTRIRWVSETAECTIERLEAFDDETNEDGAMAREHYEASDEAYRQAVVETAQSLVEAPTDATDEAANTSDEAPSG